MPTLSNEEIEQKLEKLDGWVRADAKTIERIYTFDQYFTGISFVEKIAHHAEKIQHHPHITINHTTVAVRFSTLDEGGITNKDIESAFSCNEIFRSIS